jgi:Zn finger protein HypA/HybF involved in hydrogenase expression
MNLLKKIDDSEVNVELVAIECNCGNQMKIDKKVIEKDEAFMCPNCRKIGFTH